MEHLEVSSKVKVKDLFGGEGEYEIPVYKGSETTPAVNETYNFRSDLRLAMLYFFMGPRDNLYIHGPTGSGKSSLVEQTAARLGREVFKVSCHERMEFQDFTGLYIKGGHEYVEGPLVKAMKRGGIFLLDEWDQLPPSTAIGLNGVLDGQPLMVPETGELVQPHPMFRIAATGNSAGSGDATRIYKGVKAQNAAALDRFASLVVDYMSAEEELAVLNKAFQNQEGKPLLAEPVAQAMIEVANEVRGLFKACRETGMNHTVTTRTLIRWARRSLDMAKSASVQYPVTVAFEVAFLNRLDPEQRAAVEGITSRVFGKKI